MPNVRLVIEYDGSGFHGWQKQPGVRTIQDELEKIIRLVLREDIPYVMASGRTDAGVHARGQVVNFKTAQVPDLRRLGYSISSILKGEVSVVRADFVPDEFHSCRSTKRKEYRYTILHRDAPAVLDRRFVWHVGGRLDVDRMRDEASSLVGEWDFTSMRASGCESPSAVKRILESELLTDGDYLIYRVVGEGFLKQMVRIIVGTLVEMGRGDITAAMGEILASRDRRSAGLTAPAQGLCLEWVEY